VTKVKRERWKENFGEWFRSVLVDAGIMDYRYPIKGCGVWLPYGFKLRRNIFQILRDLLDKTGHEEVQFPLLIPETSLARESAHVRSFEEECFWVTHGGSSPLAIKYALRPTSETAMAPMLKLWIRSHADLPILMYQIVNVFRYETKATRPLIREREVSTFKEAHTSHRTFEEAEEQVRKAVEIYRTFFDELGVPYIISKRPEWDKFPGSQYTIAFDTICPDGRTLQIGTVHNLGQNFSKAFDILYEKEDGSQEYIWQTCYGISGRVIAAFIATHGDDHGIVLTPKVAPIEVVVVPIPYKEKEDLIRKVVKEVSSTLEKKGISFKVDDREDLTPGSKFYYWELRGVPIRLEIGPKDAETKEVTIVRRDTLERRRCSLSEFTEEIHRIAEAITKNTAKRAWEWLKEHVKIVESLDEAKKLMEERYGIVELRWCGDNKCGMKMEEKVGARVLGTPIDNTLEVEGECALCGRKAENVIRMAIAY